MSLKNRINSRLKSELLDFLRRRGYLLYNKNRNLPRGINPIMDIKTKLKYKRIKTVFDVGANIGQTVKWIKDELPDSVVYAFEPIHSTYIQLEKNVFDYKNVITENFAFGDKKHVTKIHIKGNNLLNSLKNEVILNKKSTENVETVVVNTIDTYVKDKNIDAIDILKIDTEGYELHVLKGAVEMLNNERINFIFSEVGFLTTDQYHTYFCSLLDFLSDFNFQFYALYDLTNSMSRMKKGTIWGNALFYHRSILEYL